ncbi:MAG: alpha-galactosidase [Ignavibacteria bacterium]|nr:alpha-galactosidase [Ignavibacteria bacterium]
MTPHRTLHCCAAALLALVLLALPASAQRAHSDSRSKDNTTWLMLSNERVAFEVTIDNGKLAQDRLAVQHAWAKEYGTLPSILETDADWSAEIMWTDWRAPLKANNADNPVELTKRDFTVKSHSLRDLDDGAAEAELLCESPYAAMTVRIIYRLDGDGFHVRKKLVIADSADAAHFLEKLAPVDGLVLGRNKVVKDGGFGQPIALQTLDGGAFLGLEYPAANNTLTQTAGKFRVLCSQDRGERITRAGIESDWAVIGVTPNFHVKWWFMRYVDGIRVAPLKPFALYNSWYDLRSTEYPGIAPQNAMNEQNVLRIVDLMKRNMVDKHGLALDAFVLDDGWDAYESDWALRKAEFPRGLAPVSDALRAMGTTLGIWFGPTGGYSFRMKRISWMQEHGYETVGTTKNTAMLCVGGKKYGELLQRRVTDFIDQSGVGYFKWDGVQFSCSEPGHGHLPGIHSRRAVLESVTSLAKAARAKKPDTYINLTSGTWLSPWWLRTANQIWMQGEDYGYADVPSISPRDAAITYRDLVLYDGLRRSNFWFPMANLMTHGIIKGTLEKLGGEEEPIDKFTNEVVLYLSRGVSMWELYISPDILSDAEWDALGASLRWARDRWPVLANTEMVGGDPKKREPYGYVHFTGARGIIAARNPWIDVDGLRVQLLQAYGVDPAAVDLVIEKVYPERWISPRLYKANETILLPLVGYETAIYEVYPLAEARRPLLAGLTFARAPSAQGAYGITAYGRTKDAVLLNPVLAGAPGIGGRKQTIDEITERIGFVPEATLRKGTDVSFDSLKGEMRVTCSFDKSVERATIAVLLESTGAEKQTKSPLLMLSANGAEQPVKRVEGESASR